MKIINTQKIVTIEFLVNELIDIANDIYKIEKTNTNIDALLKLKKLINTIEET